MLFLANVPVFSGSWLQHAQLSNQIKICQNLNKKGQMWEVF